MRVLAKCFVLELCLALMFLLPLHAQTAASAPATNASAANPKFPSQAPDEATKKITDLVHAGKYAEAQQLTAGLLIAYPNDARLIKAKALIDGLLSPVGKANGNSGGNQLTTNVAPAQPAPAEQLSGMDKVDYNALIELARDAQQNTDLGQQKASLKQFMDQSSPFLQKHPTEMLLWQLRAASAISLDDPMSGYEAGQKLLAAGAADSNDPNLQRLLAQLKNKGWLDKQETTKQTEETKQSGWMLGTWRSSWSDEGIHRDQGNIVFSKSDSGSIKSYGFQPDGTYGGNVFRGTVLNSREIRWEVYLDPSLGCCPSGWQPVILCEVGSNERTIKFLVPSQWATERDSKNGSLKKPNSYVLTKISDAQNH
jgi:hypothetical protein